MATYRELVYMVLDELKARSDDFYYTEDHIMFLLDKYRAFLLKQKYSDVKKQIPISNFQKIKVIKDTIPAVMNISTPYLESSNGDIYNFCSEKRFKYIGYRPYLSNCKYFTLGTNFNMDPADPYSDKQYDVKIKLFPETTNLQEEDLYITAIFEQPSKAQEYTNDYVNIFDWPFPLEESLISPLLEMTVKDLTSAVLKPEDNNNNGKDDLGDLNKYMYQNTKSDLQKQIYG